MAYKFIFLHIIGVARIQRVDGSNRQARRGQLPKLLGMCVAVLGGGRDRLSVVVALRSTARRTWSFLSRKYSG